MENRQSFFKRFSNLSYDEAQLLDFAYDLAKEGHRTHKRDGGDRYFEHVRNVALILIDECHVTNLDIIAAALLHDTVEDSPIFGSITKPYSERKLISFFRLNKIFNAETANLIITLTKPAVDGVEIKTAEDAHELYLNNFRRASPAAVLIKMADRLHNLRSLEETTEEKRNRVIKETKEEYLPIFEELKLQYTKEALYLVTEIKKLLK